MVLVSQTSKKIQFFKILLFDALKLLTCFNLTISASVTVSPASIGGVAPGVSIIVDVGTLVKLLAIVGGGEHTGLRLYTVGPGLLVIPAVRA